MPRENFHYTSFYKILSEIEKNTKDYMTTQFEHNKFFPEELKEHSILLDAIAKCGAPPEYHYSQTVTAHTSPGNHSGMRFYNKYHEHKHFY